MNTCSCRLWGCGKGEEGVLACTSTTGGLYTFFPMVRDVATSGAMGDERQLLPPNRGRPCCCP